MPFLQGEGSIDELPVCLEPHRKALQTIASPAIFWGKAADELPNGFVRLSFDNGDSEQSCFIPEGEPWPHCGVCDRPLCITLQIYFNELSKIERIPVLPQFGLYQFFYCWDCFPLYSDEATEGEICTRWYPDFNHETFAWNELWTNCRQEKVEPATDATKGFAAHLGLSFPDPRDYNFDSQIVQDFISDEKALAEYLDLVVDEYPTQVGGVPHWIQNADFVSCDQCGADCLLLAAIGSESGLLWGDSGYCYIFSAIALLRVWGLVKHKWYRSHISHFITDKRHSHKLSTQAGQRLLTTARLEEKVSLDFAVEN